MSADRGELGKYAVFLNIIGVLMIWSGLFFVPAGELDERAVEWLSGFDAIISYLHDPDGVWEDNVKRVWRGEWISGPGRPPDNENRSISKILLEPLKAWGIAGANPEPCLTLPNQADSLYALGAHPGSGSRAKNWPETCWEQFLQHSLVIEHGGILLIAGEAEQDRLGWMESVVGDQGKFILGNHFWKPHMHCVSADCL